MPTKLAKKNRGLKFGAALVVNFLSSTKPAPSNAARMHLVSTDFAAGRFQYSRCVSGKNKKSFDWIKIFYGYMKPHLDNIVFRLGFAKNIPAARQLLRHSKVSMNGKKQSIGSFITQTRDKISLTSSVLQNTVVLKSINNPHSPLAFYLSLDASPAGMIRNKDANPSYADFPFAIERNLVFEYYSKLRSY